MVLNEVSLFLLIDTRDSENCNCIYMCN